MEAGKWYLVGNPFVSLNGDTDVAISEIFQSGFKNRDSLFVHNPETLTYESPLYWHEDVGGWCPDPFFLPSEKTTRTLKPGDAVYISKGVTSEITLQGKVKPVEVTFGNEQGNTWAQVVVMWPDDKSVNDFDWQGLTDGDTLMILNSETASYDKPLYWSTRLNNGAGAWSEEPFFIATTPSQRVIQAGQGLFLNKKSAGRGTVLPQ